MTASKSTAVPPSKRQFDLDPVKLRRLRMRAGLSAAELAAAIGASRGSVCDWEKARYGPSVPNARLIAQAIGCDLGDLMTDIAA
jgi:DNA-binding XRE family transcriptional regulator